jgi:phage terminase large subunit
MVDGAVETRRIVIPYAPRPQFMPLHTSQKRWSITVAHRRAGKTVAEINKLIRSALECPRLEPRFAYAAPTYGQAKDVAWNYLLRFTSTIPGSKPHETELRVDLPNGARIRLYGLDNYDRLRGGYLDGIVLDEYGDSDPRAWQEVIRPALSDRQGWADFIGTPNGRNHFCDLWEAAGRDEAWFRLMLRASETKLLPDAELADAAKAMSEEQYAAEYECSFAAGLMGAYYGKAMEAAERDGRIADLPWIATLPVHTGWDLGRRDLTAIWFFQLVGHHVHFIDYIENDGVDISWYAKELDKRPYKYGTHALPHDATSEHIAAEKSVAGMLATLGYRSQHIVPRTPNIDQDINIGRVLMARAKFDATKCDRGLKGLRNYRKHWDDKRKAFSDRPLHDWASNPADSYRTAAVAIETGGIKNAAAPKPLIYPKMGIV